MQLTRKYEVVSLSRMYFDVTLTKCSNAIGLYRELSRYELNVTDMISEVYVYGMIDSKDFERIARICSRYGKIKTP